MKTQNRGNVLFNDFIKETTFKALQLEHFYYKRNFTIINAHIHQQELVTAMKCVGYFLVFAGIVKLY